MIPLPYASDIGPINAYLECDGLAVFANHPEVAILAEASSDHASIGPKALFILLILAFQPTKNHLQVVFSCW